MRYFIELSYNGSNHFGWQIQKNVNTIQGELNNCLSKLLGQEINIVGAGRTDTGVHARQTFAHFDCDKIESLDSLKSRINRFLSPQISCINLFEVKDDLHSRFSAISRTYEYHISLFKDPLNIGKEWYIKSDLNIPVMKEALDALNNYSDFESFCKSNSGNKHFLCQIMDVGISENNGKLIFRIKANRFLRNMIRAIVGSVIHIGQGRLSHNEFINFIESKDNSKLPASAPAEGLYLVSIEYPKNSF